MSEQRLKALIVVLLVLLVVWLGVSFIPRGGGAPGPSQTLSGFFDGVTPETVTAVHFQGPGQDTPVGLERSGNQWRVNGYRADSATVARFWTTIENARIGDLVASNPASHSRLGVAADSSWRMEVDLPGGSRTLLVGDAGSRYGTTYVRLPDEDQVYLLDGNLRAEVTRGLDGWRNKALARVDTASVQRLIVERAGGGYELARSDSLWQVAGDGEANQSAVRTLLGELTRLDASGFYPPGTLFRAPAGPWSPSGSQGTRSWPWRSEAGKETAGPGWPGTPSPTDCRPGGSAVSCPRRERWQGG